MEESLNHINDHKTISTKKCIWGLSPESKINIHFTMTYTITWLIHIRSCLYSRTPKTPLPGFEPGRIGWYPDILTWLDDNGSKYIQCHQSSDSNQNNIHRKTSIVCAIMHTCFSTDNFCFILLESRKEGMTHLIHNVQINYKNCHFSIGTTKIAAQAKANSPNNRTGWYRSATLDEKIRFQLNKANFVASIYL